MIYRAIR